MQAAEFTTQITGTGTISIPVEVRRDLKLRGGLEVKVILLRKEDTSEDLERLAAQHQEMWRRIEALREQFSKGEGSLTDALLEARQEERDAELREAEEREAS
jgi:bifunctional DNA-binding transcriptional regulator/antitoxin component of YhaV-PrlF toxin-antitoxin module